MRQKNFAEFQSIDCSNPGNPPTGAPASAHLFTRCSAQAVFTSSDPTGPLGTYKLQFSNDPIAFPEVASNAPTHWDDVPNASVSVTGNGTFTIPAFDIAYTWVRSIFAPSNSIVGAKISDRLTLTTQP